MKNSVKIIVLILVIALLVGIASYFLVKSNKTTPNNAINEFVENDRMNSSTPTSLDLLVNNSSGGTGKYMTVSDIKAEFGENSSTSSKYMFKPFYNVEQTTEFTFRFKSNVDPIKAITVHTDSKCDENSTVFQFNDGYKTSEGVDVVVKPREPVLGVKTRSDIQSGYYWGYSPIYYICIRYDMDSTTVKKLEEPIIIPFTVKNYISTPTAYANISKEGVFSVDWLPVAGAKEYRIYSCMAPDAKIRNYTREELGYAGENTKLKLVKTVDSSVTSYINDSVHPDNLYAQKDSKYFITYISTQNLSTGNTYYVTAVDSAGHESFFSKAIADWNLLDVLPYKVDINAFSKGYITEFPNMVKVSMADNTTKMDFPINFRRVQTPANNTNSIYYFYEVPGTKLSGLVNYRNDNNVFPEEHISDYKLNSGSFYDKRIPEIAPVDVPQIIDENFANSSINLKDSVSYPESAKIKIDQAQVIRRIDLEAARMISDGTYPSPLDSISTYVASDNPEYILIREGGKIQVIKSEDYVPDKQPSVQPSTPVEKPKEEVNNDNYVDNQRTSTKRDVEEGDKEQIEVPEYPIVAKTAAQKYLAIQFINHKDKIDLKAFPEYLDVSELVDDVYYVWVQNPYIMTLDLAKFLIDYNEQCIYPKYGVDEATTKKYQKAVYNKAKEVASQIIKPGMSDYDKTIAIFEYLEKNGNYNNDALKYADTHDDFYEKYANSWNTYGILCENLGVCQSFAYAYNAIAMNAGLDTMMVTGTIKNGGHAWNATKINGKWYMIDTTNNNKNGNNIPYWFVNIGDEFAKGSALISDEHFVDGKLTSLNNPISTDNSQDWYLKHNLYASNANDLGRILKDKYTGNAILFIKYDPKTIDFNNQASMTSMREAFVNAGGNVNSLADTYIVEVSYGVAAIAPASLIRK